MSRPVLILAVFAALGAVSLCLGLMVGSVALPARDVAAALLDHAPGPVGDIVLKIRLPRVLAGFACGGLLALAGALLQVLLRNPLADPYVLGISGGAGLGLLAATSLGLGYAASQLAGLAGALAAVLTVFGLSFRAGDWNLYRLLLTGVVFSAGCGALISLILLLAPETPVKGMLFWLLGDLSDATSPQWAWLALAALGAASVLGSGTLNVLRLGRTKAASLGVPVAAAEVAIYLIASAATVTCVSLAGPIGFVGLIVPHLVRLLGVTDYRWLIPSAVLSGGTLLSLADTGARSLWAPLQIPVGALTALLGVPVVLLLLSGRR
ncbi:MAG TPA: iron ABC transporter permease [Burkholderiales bacterium]|nr:iron ABC transporter permease [Burkholderiales bacterium]